MSGPTAPVAPSARCLPANACTRARVESVDSQNGKLHGLLCDQKTKVRARTIGSNRD